VGNLILVLIVVAVVFGALGALFVWLSDQYDFTPYAKVGAVFLGVALVAFSVAFGCVILAAQRAKNAYLWEDTTINVKVVE
jgi:hypothetical protein